jgi:hypothetical protein
LRPSTVMIATASARLASRIIGLRIWLPHRQRAAPMHRLKTSEAFQMTLRNFTKRRRGGDR